MPAFNKTADYTIGVILCITSLLGTTLNGLSFLYFSTLKARNHTAQFFKILYMVITCNDFLICAVLFPNIDALFSQNREGMLKKEPKLCGAWVQIMWVLPQMSIFLVGLLSVSRLTVLRCPTRHLNPKLAIIFPAICFTTILSVSLGLRYSGKMYPNYFAEWISCTPSCFPPDYDKSANVTQGQVNNGIVIAIPYNVIPGLSIFPISISFVLSLLSLYNSAVLSSNINSSSKRQHEAAVTVVIVTSLYILFNIPYACWLGFILSKLSEPIVQGQETIEDFVKQRITESTSFVQANNYLAATVYIISPSLNSMINPAVYFWRIKSFHSSVMSFHVCKKARKVKPQIQATETRETVT